ncbi:MAG: hypothetical protein RQ824_01845 [bacterium]|nr:hypothetical protein [bacterium]
MLSSVNMKIEISKETLEKTNRCQKNFSCLSGARKDMCVVGPDDMELLVICKSDEKCGYKTPLYDKIICACPTRKELLERYDI